MVTTVCAIVLMPIIKQSAVHTNFKLICFIVQYFYMFYLYVQFVYIVL